MFDHLCWYNPGYGGGGDLCWFLDLVVLHVFVLDM